MLSYHNKPELKALAIKAAQHHADQDMLIKGTYGHIDGSFKGCSVGCDAYDIMLAQGESKKSINSLISNDPHQITSEYFGFPAWLEKLRDTLFEHLEDNEGWHVSLKESIPVGVNQKRFDIVKARFLLFILNGNIDRVNSLDLPKDLKEEVIGSINQCAALHQTVIDGGEFPWSAVESAAWSAVESAVESAARSAGSAVRSAGSAVESAESAARSADSARSARSARSAESAAESARSVYETCADKLIELLKEA